MSRRPVHLYRCVVNFSQSNRMFYVNSVRQLSDVEVRFRAVEKGVSNANVSGLSVTASDIVDIDFVYRGVM
ncbi:hypothetical protein MHB85_20415 [Paenibacillus sp. FSL K6-4396]|uniref:hypothetical protein n=1 Tax=Paenibacillus sp. FSL K6-4396 TaxID=2921506 RepID=UPI0030FAD5CB